MRKVTNIFHPVTHYFREFKGSTVLLNQVNPVKQGARATLDPHPAHIPNLTWP